MLIDTPQLETPDVAEFRERVEALYADVQRWLGEAEPGCAFSRSAVQLDEMATGPYAMPVLEVARPAGERLRFVPRARYMLDGQGLVEVRSNLGDEDLVWVQAGAPAIGFKFPEGAAPVEHIGEPLHPDLAEGWTWSDVRGLRLIHLDRDVFLNRVVETLS